MSRILVISTVFALVSTLATAQPVSIERKQISVGAARKMVDGCMAFAERNKSAAAIAVVDIGGALLDLHVMDGINEASSDAAIMKARTAARFTQSTKALAADVSSGKNQVSVWMHGLPREGGEPVMVDGHMIGAIGVSGQGVGAEACAHAGIEAAFGKQAAAPSR